MTRGLIITTSVFVLVEISINLTIVRACPRTDVWSIPPHLSSISSRIGNLLFQIHVMIHHINFEVQHTPDDNRKIPRKRKTQGDNISVQKHILPNIWGKL